MTCSFSAIALALAIPLSAAAADETYTLDAAHSQPSFEVSHMGFSMQHGVFTKGAVGKVTLDRAARKGTIDITIDTASVRSLTEKLDAHIKGEDFFNVAKYPTMTFKSSNLTFDGDKVVAADGELTMLGVSKPVTVKVANFMCGEQPFNKKPLCGDEVKITIPVEAYRES